MEVSIVIPIYSNYNEKRYIDRLVEETKRVLTKIVSDYEIIIINISFDKNVQIDEKKYKGEIININQVQNYGDALKQGFKTAKGKYIITIEPGHNPTFIEELFKNKDKAEVIIASRYVSGGKADMSIIRKILSVLLNKSFAYMLSIPIKDISSSFRMYNRKVFENLKITATDFDILEEILIRIYGEGFSIIEIPFYYQSKQFRKSNKNLAKFTFSYLKTFIKMWRLRNSIFSADYDERAFNSRIPIQRYWQRKRYEIIMNFLQNNKDNVLDIGCGSSKIIQSLSNAIGFDIDLKKLRYLRKTNTLLIKGHINALPFKDNIFKAIICSNVIEHIKKQQITFDEFYRVLKRDGILIIGTPDYDRISWRIIEWVYGKVLPGAYAEQHITHYTKKELIGKLKKFGFEVLEYKYICNSEMIIKARKKQDGYEK